VPRNFSDYAWTPRSTRAEVFYLLTSFGLFVAALLLGWQTGMFWQTFPLLGTSVLLESQPGAVASVALGFMPWSGGIISILGNVMVIPILLVFFRQVIQRWNWARNKIRQAQKWADRYERYGVGALIFLSPFLGAYVSIAIGYAMGARPLPTFAATFTGMVISVTLIVYGGHWIVKLVP
jgi:uncharacterized membrane protein